MRTIRSLLVLGDSNIGFSSIMSVRSAFVGTFSIFSSGGCTDVGLDRGKMAKGILDLDKDFLKGWGVLATSISLAVIAGGLD